jgi:hypothetical protein
MGADFRGGQRGRMKERPDYMAFGEMKNPADF